MNDSRGKKNFMFVQQQKYMLGRGWMDGDEEGRSDRVETDDA
jgi:hypothetical protein